MAYVCVCWTGCLRLMDESYSEVAVMASIPFFLARALSATKRVYGVRYGENCLCFIGFIYMQTSHYL